MDTFWRGWDVFPVSLRRGMAEELVHVGLPGWSLDGRPPTHTHKSLLKHSLRIQVYMWCRQRIDPQPFCHRGSDAVHEMTAKGEFLCIYFAPTWCLLNRGVCGVVICLCQPLFWFFLVFLGVLFWFFLVSMASFLSNQVFLLQLTKVGQILHLVLHALTLVSCFTSLLGSSSRGEKMNIRFVFCT